MWRKSLLAIWRNSGKSCAFRKRTPASAATIDAAKGVVQAAGSVITQYPESLPPAPPRPACPSFTPNGEQRFTPNNSLQQIPPRPQFIQCMGKPLWRPSLALSAGSEEKRGLRRGPPGVGRAPVVDLSPRHTVVFWLPRGRYFLDNFGWRPVKLLPHREYHTNRLVW